MWSLSRKSPSGNKGESGQSGRVQVTLELPNRTSVQRAKVKVKGGVCDVEMSCLLDEVNDLEQKQQMIVSTLEVSSSQGEDVLKHLNS